VDNTNNLNDYSSGDEFSTKLRQNRENVLKWKVITMLYWVGFQKQCSENHICMRLKGMKLKFS
jgi:hypothetical protein